MRVDKFVFVSQGRYFFLILENFGYFHYMQGKGEGEGKGSTCLKGEGGGGVGFQAKGPNPNTLNSQEGA